MTLIITVLISVVLTFIFSLRFKNSLILILIIMISSVILLEVLITKDIAAFYYRYYYHWLFLIPILLTLPFSFIKEKKNRTSFLIIIFLIWGYFFIRFPIMNVLQNIKYLNTDSTWFDSFSREYALGKVNIYDYIDWQFPKMKGIIKWCGNREEMTDLFTLDPKLRYFDNEKLLQAFFVKCNYKNITFDKTNTLRGQYGEIIINNPGVYYTSLEYCQPELKNPFSEEDNARAYNINQMLVCGAKQVMPYLYVLPKGKSLINQQ